MNKNKPETESADFKEAVELLSICTTVETQLAELEAQLNKKYLTEVEDVRPNYALMQATYQEASAKLEEIALKHPEWFGEKKSVKTPFGSMSFHKSTSHEAANEEVSVLLIEARLREIDAHLESPRLNPEAKQCLFEEHNLLVNCLRHNTELDFDAVAKLDEAALKKFRIARTEKNNFSIKAAKLDLGKAVKLATKQQEQKEAA